MNATDRAACMAAQLLKTASLVIQATLEALESAADNECNFRDYERAANALRAALEQPTQPQDEPVAWCALTASGKIAYFDGKPMVMPGPVGNDIHSTPLYPASPQRVAQPDTVPWPVVSRYSGGASAEGVAGRVWIRLGDGPEEVEYRPTPPQDEPDGKPTPGPWEVAPSHDPICVQSHRGYAIADMAEWGSIEDPNEHAANARLIAAAPDLLEALQAILPFIPTTTATDGGAAKYSANVRAADMVRAAIERATGDAK